MTLMDDRVSDDAQLAEWFEKLQRLEEPKRSQMMAWVKQELARERSLRSHRNAAELAASLDPTWAITEANRMVAEAIEECIHTRRGRLLITMPPQEGKTSLAAVYGVVRALQWHPEWRCMLASFSSILAEESSIAARNLIQKHGTDAVDPLTGIKGEDELGLALAYDRASAAAWRLRGHRGGLVAVGLGGTISGRPADLLIIDDPIKGMEAADSNATKKHVIEGFQGDLTTRLSAGAPIILIQCMTGDTPVLRPDGTETPLQDIRPGDRIATYENGALGASTVVNWASQGCDDVLCIKMMSGRTVRANARHPFLTSEGVWKRAGQITSGDQLVALSAAPGSQVLPALPAATNPHDVRACATAATTRTDGREASDRRRTPERCAAARTSSTGTALAKTSSTESSPNRAGAARCADGSPRNVSSRSIGAEPSALTTVTTATRSEACCATTATSCSGVDQPLNGSAPGPTISTDMAVSVEPCGVAEVFDIQVERTENFIANGLVSHNTRWAVDDLAGWLLAQEEKKPPSQRRWKHLNIPAVAEEGLKDSLGRKPGTWLVSARGRTPEDWKETRDIVGSRVWAALYQGSPSPLEGGLVKKAWLNDHRLLLPPKNPVLTVVGVDPAETGKGDEAGIVAACLTTDDKVAMIADKTSKMTSDEWVKASVKLAIEVGASRIVVEAFSAGTTYKRLLQEEVEKKAPGRDIEVVPWPPKNRGGGDSHTRSTALLAQLENGRTVLAGHFPEWEARATGWQIGQHQPDGMSALVVAHDELIHAGGLEWEIEMPFESTGDVPIDDWMSRPLS